jgi:hypothetical protein
METKALDLAGLTLNRVHDGLLIETGLKGIAVHFKFDGTYVKMKRWNDLYVKPMSILKECPDCLPQIDIDRKHRTNIQYKSRSLGATTLMQLQDLRCAYTMTLFGDSEGNFAANLDWEDIKFHDGGKFYHIKTHFPDNQTELLSGAFEDESIKDATRLSFPAVNTSGVHNTDQLLNKLKLYNVFS